MVKVKICGLFHPCDIDAVNEAEPDYIGFVFADSRRKVTPQKALELRKRLAGGIIPVGVFANESAENIVAIISAGIIGAVQLHGAEDEAFVKNLKARTDKPVIKANGGADSAADYLLFDNAAPGSGQTFDWAVLGKINRPFFLAGGLNQDNVADAIRQTEPFAVDVSSGVETNGVKDKAKIMEFIRRARHG